MTGSTKNIDQLIREALGQADAELLDQFGEQSIVERTIETFVGRRRLFTGLTVLVGLLLTVTGVIAWVRFLEATDPRAMKVWGGVALLCLAGMGGVKVWSWLELTRTALVREIKRLELQVAKLSSRGS